MPDRHVDHADAVALDPQLRTACALDDLDVCGVVVGDMPCFRVVYMRFGGVKDSGLGREGIRYAIEDMTELRLMVMRDP